MTESDSGSGLEQKTFQPGKGMRSHLPVLILSAVVIFATSFATVRTYALYANNLAGHPHWTSTKPTLRRGVMGAIAFVFGQQALAQNRLNLGAWFGFQEVLYWQPLDLAKVEFRFRVEDDGYIHVLYDHRADGFAGVRLSNSAMFPSIAYQATIDGEFTHVTTLRRQLLAPGAWHRTELEFEDHQVVVTVDGVNIGKFSRLPGSQQIGFRGGQRNAWIDEVTLVGSDGQVYTERFSNWQGQWVRLGLVFSGLLLLTLVVRVTVPRLASIPLRDFGFGIVMVCMVVDSALGGAYLLQYLTGSSYMPAESQKRVEAYWVNSSRNDIVGGIRSRYTAAVPPGVFRVLVLGSSQTWGAGAESDDETWVRQLEILLNASLGDVKVECINAGISSLVSGQVVELLSSDLANMAANAALINLSSNDIDVAEFEGNLNTLIRELQARNIQPVFILEPNSLERRLTDSPHGDLGHKHAIMRKVAANYGVPAIDLHGYLAEVKDTGFIWWDFVHLTSFGQRLVAAKLAGDLPSLLGIDGRRARGVVHDRDVVP